MGEMRKQGQRWDDLLRITKLPSLLPLIVSVSRRCTDRRATARFAPKRPFMAAPADGRVRGEADIYGFTAALRPLKDGNPVCGSRMPKNRVRFRERLDDRAGGGHGAYSRLGDRRRSCAGPRRRPGTGPVRLCYELQR